MRAVALSGFGGFDNLRTVEVDPPKPEASEVLIAVKAAGINFAELELTKGRYPSSKQPPFIMGFEVAGTVIATGSQVKTVETGDRVRQLYPAAAMPSMQPPLKAPASRSQTGSLLQRRPRSRSRDCPPTLF